MPRNNSLNNAIIVKNGSNNCRIPLQEILYVESYDKKIIIYTENGNIECYQKISCFERMLGASFYRCHRCYIVNMAYVMSHNATVVRLKNGVEIPLSRRKYAQFTDVLLRFSNRPEILQLPFAPKIQPFATIS